MLPHYYIGLDLGQAGAFSACSVLERPATEESEPVYGLRHLHRFPFGIPFAKIVHEVERLVGLTATDDDFPTLLIDQTGVGRPVVELFRRASLRVSMITVCITAGQQASTMEDGTRLVPKVELISSLQVLLQARRLRMAQGLPDAQLLVRELQNYRMKVTLATSESAGAWRENQHDDLVFAVALACWLAEREPPWGPDAFAAGGDSLVAQMPPDVSLTEAMPHEY